MATARVAGTQIAQGEIFQAVLSQRFEQRFEGDPFTLYRVLRLVNPAPHMFFFEADGLCLVGSSPERLVSLRGGVCEVVPIAGTRPRGADETWMPRTARSRPVARAPSGSSRPSARATRVRPLAPRKPAPAPRWRLGSALTTPPGSRCALPSASSPPS